MAGKVVYMMLKGDEVVKAITASEAEEDPFQLILKEDGKVVASFELAGIEHWYSVTQLS